MYHKRTHLYKICFVFWKALIYIIKTYSELCCAAAAMAHLSWDQSIYEKGALIRDKAAVMSAGTRDKQ